MRKANVRILGSVALAGALGCSLLVSGPGTSGASGTVQVISGSQFGLNFPQGVSSDGTDVWVANRGNNSVTELSAATGALVQVINGSQYHFNAPTAVYSDGTTVWVANSAGNSVTELSAATGALVQVISGTLSNSQPELSDPTGIAVSGGSVWVSNWGPTVVGERLLEEPQQTTCFWGLCELAFAEVRTSKLLATMSVALMEHPSTFRGQRVFL